MIDLIPTSEQQEIADALASFLVDTLPVERFRGERQATEANPEIWSGLAEIGAFGISAPEEAGGLGLTMAEETLAFREYGRHLVSPAILGTVLAIKIAAAAGNNELAGELIGGSRRAGLGLTTAVGVQLFEVGPNDLVVVWDQSGASLFEANALGDIKPQECTDGTVNMGLIASLPEKPLAHVAAEAQPLPSIASVLIAAMLSGIQEAIRDQVVLYAQDRHQFGRPIGSFQAVKHRCADIATGAELSWCETVYAALTQVEGTADAKFHAVNSKLIAGTYALEAARVNIQLHGGIGFTSEINAHLYLKRTHLLNELGGSLRVLKTLLNSLPSAA